MNGQFFPKCLKTCDDCGVELFLLDAQGHDMLDDMF